MPQPPIISPDSPIARALIAEFGNDLGAMSDRGCYELQQHLFALYHGHCSSQLLISPQLKFYVRAADDTDTDTIKALLDAITESVNFRIQYSQETIDFSSTDDELTEAEIDEMYNQLMAVEG